MGERDALAATLPDLERVSANASAAVERERVQAREIVLIEIRCRAGMLTHEAEKLAPILNELRYLERALVVAARVTGETSTRGE